MRTGRVDSWPIWDLVTIAHVLDWTSSDEWPRPRLRDDLTFDLSARPGTMRWITPIDNERLWAEFRSLLSGR